MSKDPQARRWQITVNNPTAKGFDHERIKTEMDKLKSVVYWCMADEQGLEEQTPHTHIYLACSSPVRFSTLKNLFPSAHFERANGTSQQNRDYLSKTGKWADTDKAETVIDGTFEEWGDMPVEARGNGMATEIIERIQDGATNAELLLEFPKVLLRGLRDIDHIRQTLIAEEFCNKWRNLETTYIWGATGAGKTRLVRESYGYSNVCAVTDYRNHPFDCYKHQPVLLFDEFDSGIRITDMNNYLDGYPLFLPARYNLKVACYERVYIVSNLDLRKQYIDEYHLRPEVWFAFMRRIHKVIHFMPDGTRRVYDDVQGYLDETSGYVELPKDAPHLRSDRGEGDEA